MTAIAAIAVALLFIVPALVGGTVFFLEMNVLFSAWCREQDTLDALEGVEGELIEGSRHDIR